MFHDDKKIHPEKTIINVFVLDNRGSKYTKQKLAELKWESSHSKKSHLKFTSQQLIDSPLENISKDKRSEQHYKKTWPYWHL